MLLSERTRTQAVEVRCTLHYFILHYVQVSNLILVYRTKSVCTLFKCPKRLPPSIPRSIVRAKIFLVSLRQPHSSAPSPDIYIYKPLECAIGLLDLDPLPRPQT